MPAVSVIVPARDARATLPRTLDALAALDDIPGGFEVVLADDGSTDGTREIAEAHPAVTLVVDAGGNGPGAARNAAAARATGELLAFTDADCVPDPGWLAAMVATIDTGADLIQGRVDADGPVGPFDRTVRVGQLSGLFETANLAVRREWFERVGGFQPWLNPKRSKELGEDVWLGWRLRRAGAQIVYAPDAIVRHAVFDGNWRSFVGEHARLRFFPMMVARIPELRTAFLYQRYFLNARSQAFDIGVLGIVLCFVLQTPIGVLGVLPYLLQVWRATRPFGRRRLPLVASARVAADTLGFFAMIAGSIRARRLVI